MLFFFSDIFQNYLVFIPTKIYIKYLFGTTANNSQKSNGMSEENIENITKSCNNSAPIFVDHHVLAGINFNGQWLINNIISNPKNVINLYISYILNRSLRNLNTDSTLKIAYLDL